jgi:hypothetical protein
MDVVHVVFRDCILEFGCSCFPYIYADSATSVCGIWVIPVLWHLVNWLVILVALLLRKFYYHATTSMF